MRSAYGFKVPAEDSTLTHVTPGSPMLRWEGWVSLICPKTSLPKNSPTGGLSGYWRTGVNPSAAFICITPAADNPPRRFRW